MQNGVDLTDENNNSIDAKSKTAAFQGISAVVLSRIGMACPGMGKFNENIVYLELKVFIYHILLKWKIMTFGFK